MGERAYVLGIGTMYLGDETLGVLKELGLATEDPVDESIKTIINRLDEGASFTGYLKLGRTNGKSELAVWHMLMGIEKRIMELCPNKRVVHLAYHAKKQRARDKNYKRMCKIVEKLGGIK